MCKTIYVVEVMSFCVISLNMISNIQIKYESRSGDKKHIKGNIIEHGVIDKELLHPRPFDFYNKQIVRQLKRKLVTYHLTVSSFKFRGFYKTKMVSIFHDHNERCPYLYTIAKSKFSLLSLRHSQTFT